MNTNRKMIGQGKSAKIYKENDFVYKSFSNEYPDHWIKYEARVQNEVYNNTHLNVPKARYIETSKEIEMAYIEGYTLADRIRKEKYKFGLEDLVATQLSIYHYANLDLPQAHESFMSSINRSNLEKALKDKALNSLNRIERKMILCHFDIHFLNILYKNNEYYIIDWVNAKLGNPVMDIARTYIILKQYAQRLSNKYLKLIAKQGTISIAEIEAAIPLMAALRLIDHDSATFKNQLLELIK